MTGAPALTIVPTTPRRALAQHLEAVTRAQTDLEQKRRPVARLTEQLKTARERLAAEETSLAEIDRQHAATIRWADTGVQIGLAPAAVHVQAGFDAERHQELARVLDQRQVGIAAHGRETDQPIEDLDAVHTRIICAMLTIP